MKCNGNDSRKNSEKNFFVYMLIVVDHPFI